MLTCVEKPAMLCSTMKTAYNSLKKNLIACTTAAYTHQKKILPQDHYLFQRSLSNWESQLVSTMKTWLLHNTPYINHCLKIAKTQAAVNIQDIKTFMPGTPSSTTLRRKKLSQIPHSILKFTVPKRPHNHPLSCPLFKKTWLYKLQDNPR
eukprot:15346798-Ditylum_brightwellii.AAC.1